MSNSPNLFRTFLSWAIAVLLIAGVAKAGVMAQDPAKVPSAGHESDRSPAKRSHYSPNPFPKQAMLYYQNVWGIDSLEVRTAESGELIRFNFRVLDASKASQLNDKKLVPTLIAPRAGVMLVIPSLEKVGQLRQSGTAEDGKVYWMAFSNPRRTVKAGDRVNVVIGHFHADGLVVE